MRTVLVLLLSVSILSAQVPAFPLRLDQLSAPLELLSSADRKVVDESLELIKGGQHRAALDRLSELSKSHPENSSLHILAAYALLQAGNILSAIKEATAAHDAPNGNSYKCAFRAKVALLNGDTVTCKDELEHVRHAGDQPSEVREIEKGLKNAKRRR